MYQGLYDWVRANAPDTRLQDLPVVPLAGFLQTGAEVRIGLIYNLVEWPPCQSR